MNNAKIIKSDDPSPASSRASDYGSTKASPHKSFAVKRKAKPKVLPIKSSARIAKRKDKAARGNKK